MEVQSFVLRTFQYFKQWFSLSSVSKKKYETPLLDLMSS